MKSNVVWIPYAARFMFACVLLRAVILVLAMATVISCASSSAPRGAVALSSVQSDVMPSALRAIATESPWTVVVFFSASCPCQRVHDARLRELARAYQGRGVRFVALDSESGASDARAAFEAQDRAYPFPILVDSGAAVARAWGVEYATYVVVLDSSRRVHYRGGIDSDRIHLRDDAMLYLRDALDDVVGGRRVRAPEGKALGCALRTS